MSQSGLSIVINKRKIACQPLVDRFVEKSRHPCLSTNLLRASKTDTGNMSQMHTVTPPLNHLEL